MVICDVHWLSNILLTFPAQVHFCLLTCSKTFQTFVFSVTQMFVFSASVYDESIHLSIFICAAASFLFAWQPLLPRRMSLLKVRKCEYARVCSRIS